MLTYNNFFKFQIGVSVYLKSEGTIKMVPGQVNWKIHVKNDLAVTAKARGHKIGKRLVKTKDQGKNPGRGLFESMCTSILTR
jgi:hypothetical protein